MIFLRLVCPVLKYIGCTRKKYSMKKNTSRELEQWESSKRFIKSHQKERFWLMLVVFILVTWKIKTAFTFLINMMKNRLITGTGRANYAARYGTVCKQAITDHFTLSGLKHRRTIIFCNSDNVLFHSSGNGKLWGSLLSYIFCHSPMFWETWLLEKNNTSTMNTWSLFLMFIKGKLHCIATLHIYIRK